MTPSAPPPALRLASLADVRHRIHLGTPLPFGVLDAEHKLLLARGQRIDDVAQLNALLERGALVDIAELHSARERTLAAPREMLPQIWQDTLDQVGQALASAEAETFGAALEEAVTPALTLIERDPDLAIFQVLSQGASVDTAYGARRSLHCAITASLVAQRLNWRADEVERAFKVALTMNLSMLALQGELAHQASPPSREQRVLLQTHPMRSVQMLERAGVADAEWLRAVLQHHEVEDGSGYPSGRSDVCDLASLARRADVYTSKLSARSTRDALAADVAGRAMFMNDPSHPMTQALVKEFGIYPPGSWVRLASGETGVVVQRGPSVTSPVVACLTDARGHALPTPRRIATERPGHAVAGLLGGPRRAWRPEGRLLAALFAD